MFYILLLSVKKIFAYLACLMAVTIIIAHDSIHHHHASAVSAEIMDLHGHDEDDHHDHEKHLPSHQHLLADEDFFPVRNVFFDWKVLKQVQVESVLVDSFSEKNFILHSTGFITIWKDPPLLTANSLTPNITRGSPALS